MPMLTIDPLICPKCGGTMRIVSFIEDHKVIDKIIKHLNLTFKATRPPPPQAQLSIEEQSVTFNRFHIKENILFIIIL